MGPTLTDVAKRANVALSTASRAFSDPDRLGPDTLRKILKVAQDLGYSPPARAPEPAGEPAAVTIAVVVPDIANPVFSAFVKAAQGQGRHNRHTVVVADSDFDPDREREAIAHLRGRVDGMVVSVGTRFVGRLPELRGHWLLSRLRGEQVRNDRKQQQENGGAGGETELGSVSHAQISPSAPVPRRPSVSCAG